MKLGELVVLMGSKDYKRHLDNTFYKYVPEGLLFKLSSRINPRIICNYEKGEEKRLIGYGIGVFLEKSHLTFDDANRLVEAIKTLGLEGIDGIIIDDYYNVEDGVYKVINEKLNITNNNSTRVLVYLLDYVLKRICSYNNINLKEQEVLVIGDDSHYTKDIVMDVSREVKFLTIDGEDDEFIDELGDMVFNDSGLSVCKTNKLNKRIKNFNFIINLRNNIHINVGSIKKKTIIFDFSEDKLLRDIIRERRRDILVIDDFIFKGFKDVYSRPKGYKFSDEISSNIYGFMSKKICEGDMIKIKVKNKTYTIKQASRLYLNPSSHMSNFYVKC